MADGSTRAAPLARHGDAQTARCTRGERRADAAVHVFGTAAALVAAAAMVAVMPAHAAATSVAAVAFYAAGLLSSFLCSALYNLAGEGRWKAPLRRLDHAAIFAMIAGTYAPVALLGIGGPRGWWLFSTVAAAALVGALLKLAAPARFERAAIPAYLLLGWAGLSALDALVAVLPARDLALLAAGGLLYSAGVGVHLAGRLRYRDALWHLLVAAAAACHYAVVLRLAAAG